VASQDVRWIFDELPPSGARRGGDPSSHAFRHDVHTLVREVVQNANDQAVSWPTIRFRFIELAAERLAAFREAIGWDTLLPHLQGAATAQGGKALASFLAELTERDRLLLLHIEDRNTIGLTGSETEGDSNFRALCKDTLYSHKLTETAGGSYGLGKSVLWTFSGLSTVLFNSVLLTHEPNQRSPRLIGRAELASHEAAGGPQGHWYTGSGWFGSVVKAHGGLRAESLWHDDAEQLSQRLSVAREDRPGTSVLIVGFRDPTAEGRDDVGELARRVRAAATRFFWPAMVMDGRRLRFLVGGEQTQQPVRLEADLVTRPFVECYRRRNEPSVAFREPGDIVMRRIEMQLPDRRDGQRGPLAHVDLVVQLAAAGDRNPLLNHVAMFRGPGMVVRYRERRGLALSARPFFAVAVCGEARNPREPSGADKELDRFLRAAEPPGHDEWLVTPALKQGYKRGYAKALKRLQDRITEELRNVLVSRPTQGSKGPDKLQRRFPIGGGGSSGGGPSAFYFSQLRARLDGEHWYVAGRIEPAECNIGWRARVSLHDAGEDHRALEPVAIASFTARSADSTAATDSAWQPSVELRDDMAFISAPVGAVDFEGCSEVLVGDEPGELVVEVDSAVVEEVGDGAR